MSDSKVYRAIGLMSGTSLDGVIDVALIETDGQDYVRPLRYFAYPYDISVRDKVRACFGKVERDAQVDDVERLVTDLHVEAVKAFGESADIIGFHGQTLTHDPDSGFTWQIGDGERLARETGINVACDMRMDDIRAGGQGAPLLPLYHKALLSDQKKPVAVLNLGGVSNITYIGEGGDLIAFDCGPANALMDDFMKLRTGEEFDRNGSMASRGTVQENLVESFLNDPYFDQKPPKSLDRNRWSIECVRYATKENGMATLLEMSVGAIARAMEHTNGAPEIVYVAGGGRKNIFLMESIAQRMGTQVCAVEDLSWNGDATESEGFAYLAVRSFLGLPLTVPTTTGVPKPMTGGVLYRAA